MNRQTEIAPDNQGARSSVGRLQPTRRVLRFAAPVTAKYEAVKAKRNWQVVQAGIGVDRRLRVASISLDTGLPPEFNERVAGDAKTSARGGASAMKRTFDIACAGALLFTLSPLFALLAILIMATSGGPVVYRHVRVGKNGEHFECFKFRTMVADADTVLQEILANDPQARLDWEEHYKLRDDPRVIPVGRFLRRTSLDELPQLWNVLRGDMSLVGPRPIVEQEINRYGSDIRCYLASVPGITGLWQISGRNELSYKDRVQLDSWYARNWCLSLDFHILWKTIWAIITGRGAY